MQKAKIITIIRNYVCTVQPQLHFYRAVSSDVSFRQFVG